MSDKGKRIIALVGIIIVLIMLIPSFRKREANQRMGLPMVTESDFAEKFKKLPCYEALENAQNILFFNNNLIPYDKTTNTFYLTQNINNSDFDGLLRPQSENIKAWWLRDGYENIKSAGIEENHLYGIAVTDGKATTILHFLLTGMPVVSITTEEIVKTTEDNTDEYTIGSISVWSAVDEDYKTISDRSSMIECKQSLSKETITFKLRDAQNENNKRISLLSMGKYDAWKLYKVKEDDETCIRMSTAIQLWNECSSVDSLKIPYRFVELILNNRYQGLYILCPRTDDDYFQLSEEEKLIRTEDLTDQMEVYKKYYPNNLSDFALWYQATDAYTNLVDDLVIVQNKENGTLFLPGKMEYVFGEFPNRYKWRTWHSQERVVQAGDFEWPEIAEVDLEKNMKEKWVEGRSSFLGNEELRTYGDAMLSVLKKTGIAKRSQLEETSIPKFIECLITRYSVIDQYYEAKEN